MSENIEIDGSTVSIDETLIVLQGEGGEPLALEHSSEVDGYAVFKGTSGETITLQFLEGSA